MQIPTPSFIHHLLHTFHQANYQIYIVGGAVRDLLSEKPVKDWDFTTNATPEQILDLFPDGFYDNQFGTVGIVNPEDKEKKEISKLETRLPAEASAKVGNSKLPIYEITTFRNEYGYTNKRHPDKIEWGQTLEDDLKRRDFTINAMALKPVSSYRLLVSSNTKKLKSQNSKLKTNFKLIDLYSGQTDLANHLIRAVGNPTERFNEDALRMIRAVRFAAQLGFIIEPDTLTAIQTNAQLIQHIAAERIRDELFKLLASDYPDDGIRVLAGTGLMEYIIPELLDAQGVDQSGHHTDDVWEHSLKSLKHCPSPEPVVRLATLIHDIGKPYTRAHICQKCKSRFKQLDKGLICPNCGAENNYYQSVAFYNHEMTGAKIASRIADRLRLSNKQKSKLVKLVRWHMFSVDERQTDKAHRRFIKNVGKENLYHILDLRTADRLGGGARETSWRYERFKKKLEEVQTQPFTLHDLQITGEEIMRGFNCKPGPQVGAILRQLFDEIVDKKIKNSHDSLTKRVKQLAKQANFIVK